MSYVNPRPRILWLNNYHVMLDFQLDPIISFIEATSEMIIQKDNELTKKIKDYDAENPEDFEWTSYDVYETDIMNQSEFSSILYNSIYTSLYSRLEITLFDICDFCQRTYEFRISAKDLGERGYIQKGKKYLEKVIGVDFLTTKEVWKKLSYYGQIRNIIVHSDGEKEVKSNELKKFIENETGISYDHQKQRIYITDKVFLVNFCNEIRRFVNVIIHEITTQKIAELGA